MLIRALLVAVLPAILLAACGTDDRVSSAESLDAVSAAPTVFRVIPVTPVPSPTPWPDAGPNGQRPFPDGLNPDVSEPAEPDAVVSFWRDYLTGAQISLSSRRRFRSGPLNGALHMCGGGVGLFVGNPDGTVEWKVASTTGRWYEATLTFTLVETGRVVGTTLSVADGQLTTTLSEPGESLPVTQSFECGPIPE